MEADKASTTALGVAYLRAYHCKRHEPKIFSDTCAWQLLTEEERRFFSDILLAELQKSGPEDVTDDPVATLDRAAARYPTTALVVARSAISEQRLKEAIARGVDQYVIVGAGMDTFAFREPELSERVRIFEIDHPATQSFKRQRATEARFELPPHLYFAPADFERDSVASALANTPFDARRPSFFAWHGVTMYLTQDAISASLASIRSVAAPGSEIVFDYWDASAFDPTERSKETSALFDLVASFGEPFVSGFAPKDLSSELAMRGFSLVEDVGPDEQARRFFTGRRDGMRPLEIARIAHARVGEHRLSSP